jgi:hypothetical protein
MGLLLGEIAVFRIPASPLMAGLWLPATMDYIYVWDITSSDPLLIETLVGGTGGFTSITFSSPPPSSHHPLPNQLSSGKLVASQPT